MTKPQSPALGGGFDLVRTARELCAESAYVRDGHTARTLIRSPDLRIVFVAIRAKQTISEHHANATVAVQTVTGHIHLRIPEQNVALPAGHLFVLRPGLPHEVQADDDSTFLVTLGWRVTDRRQPR